MNQITAAEAIERITQAGSARDLFAGDYTQPAAARRARRTYRLLIALIHPDLATRNGIDPARAGEAAAKLNDLYLHWWAGTERQDTTRTPHVVGEYDRYLLGARIRRTSQISTYATGHQGLFVAISRTQVADTDRLIAASRALAARGLAAFGPEPVDHGLVSGRSWVAYRLPAGLYCLREMRTGYPEGLDGRDWAWMARRILMALNGADQPRAGLSLDAVLVHPGEHGIVLTGWGSQPARPMPAESRTDPDGDDLARLFDQMLDHRPDARRQRAWATAAAQTAIGGPRGWLAEYDLLLRRIYGERRYRPFAIPQTA